MNKTNKFAGFALALALLGGCQSTPKAQAVRNHAEDFAPDDEVRPTRMLMDEQAAAGAAADITLYPAHFDGNVLNSLGTTKLDWVLRSSQSLDPVVVYLAVADDQYTPERRATITNYLIDRGGLRREQIKFQQGHQPDTYFPAREGQANLDKVNGTESGTAATPGAGAAPAATGHY